MELNRMIDHTLLKADATEQDVLKLIEEAKTYHFYSVCLNPCWVELASKELKGEPVAVCTVIGFPLGANTQSTKIFEAREALTHGAGEIDMVINIGQLKAGNLTYVKNEIAAIVKEAKDKALVKVIIETALLTTEEIISACQLAKEAGADFVKTSTGFSTAGARTADVALMRKTVGPKMGVKASGGIHNATEAIALIDAGASRIGTSAGVQILS